MIGIAGCVHLNGDRSPDARKMSNYLRNECVEASIKYFSAHDETSFVSRARQNEDAANIRDSVVARSTSSGQRHNV